MLIMAEEHKLPLTKKVISDNFGVSDVTVTKAYKLIKPQIKILKNNEATEFYIKLMEMDRKKIIKNTKQKMFVNSYCILFTNSTDKIYNEITKCNIDIINPINNTSKEYNKFIKEVNF